MLVVIEQLQKLNVNVVMSEHGFGFFAVLIVCGAGLVWAVWQSKRETDSGTA